MGKGVTEIEDGIYAVLRGCSAEANALWIDVRWVIEHSDRPGHLRQNGRPLSAQQLARVASTAADQVARALQELEEAALLVPNAEGHRCPLLADRWHARRSPDGPRPEVNKRCEHCDGTIATTDVRVRHCSASCKQAAYRERHRVDGVRRGAGGVTGVTDRVTDRSVTPVTPPPSQVSPLTLSSSFLTPENNTNTPIAAQSGDAAGPAGDAAAVGKAGEIVATPTAAPTRSARKNKHSDAQIAAKDDFLGWWTNAAYPQRHHGVAYEFAGPRDGVALWRILQCKFVCFDLVRAKLLAEVYLDAKDHYLSNKAHPLYLLANELPKWRNAAEAKLKGRPHYAQPAQQRPAHRLGGSRQPPRLNGNDDGGGG